MTHHTDLTSSILSLKKGLPFGDTALEISLVPACIWYCQFDHLTYHNYDYQRYDIKLPRIIANAPVRRRAEYLASRIAARKVIATLGYPKFDLLPSQNQSPKWPIGIQGSISHHSHLAICIGWQAPKAGLYGIGIDIEMILTPQLAIKLWPKIINLIEWKFLQTLPLPFYISLTLIFSAKESLYKALFPIVKCHFDFLDVQVISFTDTKLTLELLVELSPQIGTDIIFDCHYVIQGNELLTVISPSI